MVVDIGLRRARGGDVDGARAETFCSAWRVARGGVDVHVRLSWSDGAE